MATKDGGEEERNTGVSAAEAVTYEPGDFVLYKKSRPFVLVKIIATHRDADGEAYYTIRLNSREIQTIGMYLIRAKKSEMISVVIVHGEAQRKETVRSLDYQHLQALVRSSFPSLFPTQTNLCDAEEGASKKEEDNPSFVIVGRVANSEPECEISSDKDVEMAIQHARNEWIELCCPISHELMHNPVIASDGRSYERDEIEEWFRACRHRGDALPMSPMTNEALNSTRLEPDERLKKRIDACKKSGALGVTVVFELICEKDFKKVREGIEKISRNREKIEKLAKGPLKNVKGKMDILYGLLMNKDGGDGGGGGDGSGGDGSGDGLPRGARSNRGAGEGRPLWVALLIVALFLYVLCPWDLFPEIILGPTGFVDDAAAITYLFAFLAARGFVKTTFYTGAQTARARA